MTLDGRLTARHMDHEQDEKKANPAKAGGAKPRVLASSATPQDATKDPTIAELPKRWLGVRAL